MNQTQTQKNTLLMQIKKMNEQEALVHEQKRIAALNKIKKLRETQRNEQRDLQQRNVIPQ